VPTNRKSINNFSGCLIGGGVGDALGAPVEFMSLSEIIRKFGPDGMIRPLELIDAMKEISNDLFEQSCS
jgi:ADP-ribosylglycohydrolase